MLFVIPRKAKASLLAGCFSRSFRGRLLTLHRLPLQGGSRGWAVSRSPGGCSPTSEPCADKEERALAHGSSAGPCKTVPAVAAHGFGGGGGKASPCVLGVAARMEPAGNTAFNFLRGRERDIKQGVILSSGKL